MRPSVGRVSETRAGDFSPVVKRKAEKPTVVCMAEGREEGIEARGPGRGVPAEGLGGQRR